MMNTHGQMSIWHGIQRAWMRVRRDLPFIGIVLIMMLAALVWGLHEVDTGFEQNGLEDAWKALLLGQRTIEVSLRHLVGATLLGLVRALLLPALAAIALLTAGVARLAGAMLPEARSRSRKISWILLLVAVAMLILDVWF